MARPPVVDPVPPARRQRRAGIADEWTWHEPLTLFLAVLGVLVVVVWFSANDGVVDLYNAVPPRYTGSWLLGGWFRFDAGWYDLIATQGYSYAGPNAQSTVAFFPSYPLLLRFLHALTGLPVPLLGTLVTMASGAGVVVLFHRWCADRFGHRAARSAVLVLLVYPYAWYLFGAVYADALFLVAVLGAFVLLERGHPVWAGLVGAVATATRPVGVALIIGLVAVVLMRREVLQRGQGRVPFSVEWRRLRPGDAGVLLSAGGLLAWMGYLGRTFQEPLAFQVVQQAPGWDQGSGPHTWFKVTFLQRLGRLPGYVRGWTDGTGGIDAWKDTLYTLGITLQALLMLTFIVLLVVVWRRIGWGYAVYAAMVIAVPLAGSKDFQGVGRYLLAAFPCIAAAGLLLSDRPRARAVWLPVSASLLTGWAFAYARGYYVA
jgi:hypothetical protein